MIPVHFRLFGPARLSLGWWAWPVAPSIGDSVELTAMLPGRVMSRLWAMEVVANTPSMQSAGLWLPHQQKQLVCTVDVDVPDQPAGYVCPQCGPDERGEQAHAKSHHGGLAVGIYDQPRGGE